MSGSSEIVWTSHIRYGLHTSVSLKNQMYVAGLRDLLMRAGEYEERKEGWRKDGGILGSMGFGPSEL